MTQNTTTHTEQEQEHIDYELEEQKDAMALNKELRELAEQKYNEALGDLLS